MDPSKRVCLKNLPQDCTKREIAELVRNRTGAQPHSIDLGLSDDGKPRSYAHFSCEGAKHVIEVLGSGVMLRDSVVQAFSAHPHYSWRYAEARRKRERAEEAEMSARASYWEKVRERLSRRSRPGELPTKPPRDFYATKRCYARVAAEIAQAARAAHDSRVHANRSSSSTRSHTAHNGDANRGAAQAAADGSVWGPSAWCKPSHDGTVSDRKHYATGQNDATAAGSAPPHEMTRAAEPCPIGPDATSSANRAGAGAGQTNRGRAAGGKFIAKRKTPAKSEITAASTAVVPDAAPPIPVVSKEERKLSGLQSKLAALKARLMK